MGSLCNIRKAQKNTVITPNICKGDMSQLNYPVKLQKSANVLMWQTPLGVKLHIVLAV